MSKQKIPVNYTFHGTVEVECEDIEDGYSQVGYLIDSYALTLDDINVDSESVEIDETRQYLTKFNSWCNCLLFGNITKILTHNFRIIFFKLSE